ncbi:hypothetical protein LUZ60_017372 [Juncus effusus]|nr:hypothetical protein LUZ60_017372 [Juncus effusus]
MEDSDGLSFDFEANLDASTLPSTTPAGSLPAPPQASAVEHAGQAGGGGGGGGRRGSYRQTVCRHWLRGLCMKGDLCGFLHQYDKARMPVCRFFRLWGECREQDCVYKHSDDDIKECNMYKMGFCPNGQDCRYRHAKLPGPPPPIEEVFQRIQQMFSFNYNPPNRFYKNNFSNNPNNSNNYNNTTQNQNGEKPPQTQTPDQQQGSGQQTASQANQITPAQQGGQAGRVASPLPQGPSRYFIVKSCNRENLEISVQQGVWATQRSNESKLNEAFESTDNVILIFSINRTRHFQGCAKMTSRIGGYSGGGNWKYAHGTAHYGRNFSMKWLKLCELSFNKTHHLRNPYNDNLPVKISRDCQELEPSIGEQLASLLYVEPDSELMAMLAEAEQKRAEEKSKGVSLSSDTHNQANQDIVLFNEEEEEEEEETDDEEEEIDPHNTHHQPPHHLPWGPLPPHQMLPRVPGMMGGPPLGLRGPPFPPPPVMIGGPGPDMFMPPDMFGVPRGVFPPFGGPGPRGMMFPGGPRPGPFVGPPMMPMMRPGPGPFVGPGMGMNRPMGMQRAPPAGRGGGKREQQMQRREKEGNEEREEEREFKGGRFREESESEEEVGPRRQRYGEGKRKRRGGSDAESDDEQR